MIISPAQALLILINHHQQPKHLSHEEKIFLDRLIYFYLDGISNPSENAELQSIFKEKSSTLLSGYVISHQIDEINNDPTKRYFETHLAYESLQHGLDVLSLHHLKSLEYDLSRLMSDINPAYYHESMAILSGTLPLNHTDIQLFSEYSECIDRIKKGTLFPQGLCDDMGDLTENAQKLISIITIMFLSVRNAQTPIINAYLPLNIYGTGTFSHENRGKLLKTSTAANVKEEKSISDVRNQHYGLMKGHMPLSDVDIAKSSVKFGFFKSSEQSRFDVNAPWVRMNFYRRVHPFSNSISGTALCMLRAMLFNRGHNNFWLNNNQRNFDNFYRSFASMIVFFSGGHSLFEMVHVLNLPEVSRAFNTPQYSPGLTYNYFNEIANAQYSPLGLQLESASISRLFLHPDNKHAVALALQKAIDYNQLYLKRKKVLLALQFQVDLNIHPHLLDEQILRRIKQTSEGVIFSFDVFTELYGNDPRITQRMKDVLMKIKTTFNINALDMNKSLTHAQHVLSYIQALRSPEEGSDSLIMANADFIEKLAALEQSVSKVEKLLTEYQNLPDKKIMEKASHDDTTDDSSTKEDPELSSGFHP